MKTMRNLFYIALLLTISAFPLKGKAQISLDSYFNVDWQLNVPLGNNLSLSRTMEAIDQAFEQSPYLQRGNTQE